MMHDPTQGFQIRFDGPPGPIAGRFVEVEDLEGRGLGLGEWRQDGEDWLLVFEPRLREADAAGGAPSEEAPLITPGPRLCVVDLFGHHRIIAETRNLLDPSKDQDSLLDLRIYREDGTVVDARISRSAIYGSSMIGGPLVDADFMCEPPLLQSAKVVGRWRKEESECPPY